MFTEIFQVKPVFFTILENLFEKKSGKLVPHRYFILLTTSYLYIFISAFMCYS